MFPINKKNTLDDKEKLDWRELQDHYADQIIDLITQSYILYLKQIILIKTSLTPIDYELKPFISIRETLNCGSLLP